jgi:hypothetical protein
MRPNATGARTHLRRHCVKGFRTLTPYIRISPGSRDHRIHEDDVFGAPGTDCARRATAGLDELPTRGGSHRPIPWVMIGGGEAAGGPGPHRP